MDQPLKLLITGASGFVGLPTLQALIDSECNCFAVSRTRPETVGKFHWVKADLLDYGHTKALVEAIRPDVIVHLAWDVEHGRFWNSPHNLDWVGATLNLARCGASVGTKRFVAVGTCFEYAWHEDKPSREGSTPVAPSTLYGIAKDAARRVLAEFFKNAGVSFSWARLFFLYGPGEGDRRLVASIAKALADNRPADCSSGRAIRDFMDVRDAAHALGLIALSDLEGEINVGEGRGTSVADVAQTLGSLAERSDLIRLGALPDRQGEPPYIVADVERLRNLGYSGGRSIQKGLADALQYWMEAKE